MTLTTVYFGHKGNCEANGHFHQDDSDHSYIHSDEKLQSVVFLPATRNALSQSVLTVGVSCLIFDMWACGHGDLRPASLLLIQ